MTSVSASREPSAEQVSATMRGKPYLVLLALAAVVGVVVSLAAWCFLEWIYQIQQEVYTHLPRALGYAHGPPLWWSLPVLALAGIAVGLVIARLPGEGGHIPAKGLGAAGPPDVGDLPGILLAGIGTIGLGLVLGPEAPLIALGGGLALLMVRLSRREMPPQVLLVISAAGSFATLSFIFASPLIAAVILIEASGIGGSRLPLVLLPGLLAAGIGSLVSIGIGSFTGLSTSAYALGTLQLPHFARPNAASFGWSIALALGVALIAQMALRGGLLTNQVVRPRPVLLLPLVGLIVAGLAIAFSQAADRSVNEVLFSGQDQLLGLVAQAGAWSLSALALLIAFKGVAYALCLGSFRGGPTFPALFLGAAGGIMASHLAGFPLAAGVAVGMGAAVVAVLRLPLSAVVIATLLSEKAGAGVEPLIIVGVVAAYVATLLLSAAFAAGDSREQAPEPAAIRPAAAASR
jgi:H+/Cl- antiporter ClcA